MANWVEDFLVVGADVANGPIAFQATAVGSLTWDQIGEIYETAKRNDNWVVLLVAENERHACIKAEQTR